MLTKSFFFFLKQWLIVWYYKIVISDVHLAADVLKVIEGAYRLCPSEGEELQSIMSQLKAVRY